MGIFNHPSIFSCVRWEYSILPGTFGPFLCLLQIRLWNRYLEIGGSLRNKRKTHLYKIFNQYLIILWKQYIDKMKAELHLLWRTNHISKVPLFFYAHIRDMLLLVQHIFYQNVFGGKSYIMYFGYFIIRDICHCSIPLLVRPKMWGKIIYY